MKRVKRDGRPMGGAAPHYPNKNEGKALRQLMAKSGDSKEEVLSKKENRRIIARAKAGPYAVDHGQHRVKYLIKITIRQIARQMNLPTYDPAVKQKFNANYEVWCGQIRRRHVFGLY